MKYNVGNGKELFWGGLKVSQRYFTEREMTEVNSCYQVK